MRLHSVTCLLLAAGCSLPAWSATARLFTLSSQLANVSQPGFATASATVGGGVGTASGYDFLGGAGAFASAIGAPTNMQAQGIGSTSWTMSTTCGEELLCTLGFTLLVSGTTSVAQSAPGGSAQGAWNYNWTLNGGSFGSLSGFGGVDERQLDNGTRTRDLIGAGEGSQRITFVAESNVTYTVTLNVGAFAAAIDGASAAADFSHTLRWGGVQSATRLDGTPIPLSQVRLWSADAQFDFVNAVPPNPFTTPVPEPASAALLALGLAALGARRQVRRAQALVNTVSTPV